MRTGLFSVLVAPNRPKWGQGGSKVCGWINALCGWKPEMPLSDSKIRALVPGDKRRRVADGDGLGVVVEPIHRGGGISFVGRFRFPPGRKGN